MRLPGAARHDPLMTSSFDARTYELKLSFDELTLIYKSLLAAKALGVLPQDELVDGTIQLIDQTLDGDNESSSVP
jgi:hypothetical protein